MRTRDISSLLYDKLPEVYRKADAQPEVDYALKRYLEALSDGGITPVFQEILALYDILEVDKCPKEVLPLLGKLLGYNYIHEVDENTQRKIVANLIEIYKRKGTKSVISFITREFTQYDSTVVELQYRIFKTWSPNPKGIPTSEYAEPRTMSNTGVNANTHHLYSETGKYNNMGIIVELDAKETQIELLNRLLSEFLPVYCNLYIKVKNSLTTYYENAEFSGTDSDPSLRITEVEKIAKAKLKDSLKVTYKTSEEFDPTPEEGEKYSIDLKDTEDRRVRTFELESQGISLSSTQKVKSRVSSSETLGYTITVKEKENPDVAITFEFNDLSQD